MLNKGRRFLAGLSLVALLGLPSGALAVSYEDSLDDCSYPKLFDMLVMRPLGFVALAIGAVVWVPTAPVALVLVPRDMDEVMHGLVMSPLNFTFDRRLGECLGTFSY